jgi:hypothetical protein
MDDIHIGALVRAARLRLEGRPEDAAAKTGVSRQLISRLACCQIGRTGLATVRHVAWSPAFSSTWSAAGAAGKGRAWSRSGYSPE